MSAAALTTCLLGLVFGDMASYDVSVRTEGRVRSVGVPSEAELDLRAGLKSEGREYVLLKPGAFSPSSSCRTSRILLRSSQRASMAFTWRSLPAVVCPGRRLRSLHGTNDLLLPQAQSTDTRLRPAALYHLAAPPQRGPQR